MKLPAALALCLATATTLLVSRQAGAQAADSQPAESQQPVESPQPVESRQTTVQDAAGTTTSRRVSPNFGFSLGYSYHNLTLELGAVPPLAAAASTSKYDQTPVSGTYTGVKMTAVDAMGYYYPVESRNSQVLVGFGFEMMNGEIHRPRGADGQFYLWSYASELGVRTRVAPAVTVEGAFGLALVDTGMANLQYETVDPYYTTNPFAYETRVTSGTRASLLGRFLLHLGFGIQVGLGASMYEGTLHFDGRSTSKYAGTSLESLLLLAI